MAAVGLDPRYATHTCPHTYATHLYRASGADLEIVQEQLGHASVKTTTIYDKVIKEDKLRAANTLAKAFASTGGRKDRNQTRVSPPPATSALGARDSVVPISRGSALRPGDAPASHSGFSRNRRQPRPACPRVLRRGPPGQ